MKTIGILGGMSWESTSVYYRLINEGVRERLGGLYSAPILLYSVEFNEIAELQHQGDWAGAARLLAGAARSLETAGAQGLLIATNTMHKVAEEVSAGISIPLIHIADSTGRAIKHAGLERVGLLATGFTMREDFYKGYVQDRYEIDVLVPDAGDQAVVHDVIYDELCQGIVTEASRASYVRVIESLKSDGAQAVILGCTEIDLLVSQVDSVLPLFDSTALHAADAVEWILQAG